MLWRGLDFFKKYQTFIANLFALALMLGACFGAVIYIQEAPTKLIAGEAKAREEGDVALEKQVDFKLQTMMERNALLREARDRELAGMRSEFRAEFLNVKQALDRIEARQYDQRKRAERPALNAAGG